MGRFPATCGGGSALSVLPWIWLQPFDLKETYPDRVTLQRRWQVHVVRQSPRAGSHFAERVADRMGAWLRRLPRHGPLAPGNRPGVGLSDGIVVARLRIGEIDREQTISRIAVALEPPDRRLPDPGRIAVAMHEHDRNGRFDPQPTPFDETRRRRRRRFPATCGGGSALSVLPCFWRGLLTSKEMYPDRVTLQRRRPGSRRATVAARRQPFCRARR